MTLNIDFMRNELETLYKHLFRIKIVGTRPNTTTYYETNDNEENVKDIEYKEMFINDSISLHLKSPITKMNTSINNIFTLNNGRTHIPFERMQST